MTRRAANTNTNDEIVGAVPPLRMRVRPARYEVGYTLIDLDAEDQDRNCVPERCVRDRCRTACDVLTERQQTQAGGPPPVANQRPAWVIPAAIAGVLTLILVLGYFAFRPTTDTRTQELEQKLKDQETKEMIEKGVREQMEKYKAEHPEGAKPAPKIEKPAAQSQSDQDQTTNLRAQNAQEPRELDWTMYKWSQTEALQVKK